jgi:UDP-3-O-[3-hydroxymyristoyl] glucosamine N-acyltransferase
MTAGHTTGSLASILNARLDGPADLPVARLDTIDRAGPDALTFIRSPAFAARWAASKATAALISDGIDAPGHDPARRALLHVPDADEALIAALELFAPEPSPSWGSPPRHPSAVIDPSAELAGSAHIGPGCVIGAGARVGDHSILTANVVVGPGAAIGRACTLHPGVAVLERCSIGDRCILHAGVVIGADGFGYRPSDHGPVKIPHIGSVRIGNAVEIGANSCIDRAKFGETIVGDGTKIDNLVQIGHNCVIGRGCIICGLCGLSGSVTLGDGVVLAGGVGIADNIVIGDGARIGGRSGVMNNIPPGQTWLGNPALPHRQQARIVAALRRIARGGIARGISPDESSADQTP